MTTKRKSITAEIPLDYRVGRDEPSKGIYRNSVVLPKYSGELSIVVQHPDTILGGMSSSIELDLRPQVHLVGSARALEALGAYLVALARLETQNPEPYGMIENVQDGVSGTVRLLPRRTATSKVARAVNRADSRRDA